MNITALDECAVATADDQCVGCNHCTRVCPVETANVTYRDAEGNIKVRLDPSQCIQCGACITICKHGARFSRDDLGRFLADLASGAEISVIVAPSVRTNIPRWRQLLTWLRGLGVKLIYDVSLGADICIWAHLRRMELFPGPIITQPCPAIVSYCEKHRHELLPYLSIVHSPMACTAIHMRKSGITGAIASISPCIAKTEEHRATGLVEYNIIFSSLLRHLHENGIELPETESGFDHDDAGPGTLFPLPGGLKENIEFFTGKGVHVEKVDGITVYKLLAQYSETDKEFLPDVFDVLNCADGCLIGSGCDKEQNIFSINKQMNRIRSGAAGNLWRSRQRLEEYDQRFTLDDFYRVYTPVPKKYNEVSEDEIRHAFALMNKDTFVKRNFNCGACGSKSCMSMARKIALGVNIPMNCVIKSRDEVKYERERNAEYLDLVRNIGDNLFATRDETYGAEVMDALRILGETVGCDAVALWRRKGDVDSTLCERVYGWYGNAPSQTAILGQWPEEWVRRLINGEYVLKNVRREYSGLFPDAVTTLLTVPVRLRGEFWGFVVAISTEERDFSPEESSLLEAAGILLISGTLERELNRSLVSAREEALAGTRAKSDFLSHMSHEIRTPMNAIIGMTKIADMTEDIGKLRHCLASIRGASQHLLGLINDILDMSKIEAGKLELAPHPFDLEKTLIRTNTIVTDKAREKRLSLRFFIESGTPLRYVGDELRLSQVITNLIGNAVKFTPERGVITVRVREKSRGAAGSVLAFSVRDTGIGMTPEQQGRLFNAFTQADKSISRDFGGTGLGLAISKRIVESMNGHIRVESKPGEGSEFLFEVELPRQPEDNERNDGRPEFSGRRALVIDGDEQLLPHTAGILAAMGLETDAASSPEHAAAMLARTPYDVIFLAAPASSGIPEGIRLLGRDAAARVVAVAPYIQWGLEKKDLREAGVVNCIAKPLFPSILRAAVRSVLGVANAQPYAEKPQTYDFSGLSLLLVEDIEINRTIFQALLDPTGISIVCAENGLQAVTMFSAGPEKYDLIMMDVQMPVMDGYEATRKIRQLPCPRAATVPIIAMSANAFQQDILEAKNSGMNDYLTKPIDEKAVMVKIAEHAAGKR